MSSAGLVTVTVIIAPLTYGPGHPTIVQPEALHEVVLALPFTRATVAPLTICCQLLKIIPVAIKKSASYFIGVLGLGYREIFNVRHFLLKFGANSMPFGIRTRAF